MVKAALIRLQYRYLTTPPQELNDKELSQAIDFAHEKFKDHNQICPNGRSNECAGPTGEKHSCAYEADINNDFTKFCDCCKDCEDLCYRET